MDRWIFVLALIGVTAIGFVVRFFEFSQILKRLDKTVDYRNKFIDFLNSLFSDRTFDEKAYYWLIENVNEMQIELGQDGVFAHMQDQMRGVQTRNYQILINFLPKLRHFLSEMDMFSHGLMFENYTREAGHCDDAFVRHLGTLNSLRESTRKQLINPLTSFSYGIENILFIPFSIIASFGLLTTIGVRRIKKNRIARLFSSAVALIAFVSSVITIIIGWEEFVSLTKQLLTRP